MLTHAKVTVILSPAKDLPPLSDKPYKMSKALYQRTVKGFVR
ncbi:hypothetical protein SAMN02745146_2656 [Hymenobacter daecheongensis DSM 21074]|uniref:Uncharacterized protein n=1 Tax=Hymenobacter daecheongensis DSM 21074 TaxID=1121955 RepID=A0A1M6HV38_9BACT|nr:hypothetical protein SAMN02745146_2656 [Hymenobacter daecheongensis DSM 21074]